MTAAPSVSAGRGTTGDNSPREAGTAFKHVSMDLLLVLSVAVRGSRLCQNLVLRQGGMAAMMDSLKRAGEEITNATGGGGDGDGGRRAETCLRVLETLGDGERGRRRLIEGGVVERAFSAIGTFR